MKVILNKDISNLGEEGDIKDVARGYARNFLIPKKLVMPYTREALAILESRRDQLDHRREEKEKAALDTKTRLESEDLVLEMPAGERGRLFGSVTSATIADALAGQGITVQRKRLDIPDKTIKSVGTTRVRIRLYGDEEAELKVVVRAVGSKGDEAVVPEGPKAEAGPATETPAATEDATAQDSDAPVVDNASTAETNVETTTEAVVEGAADETVSEDVPATETVADEAPTDEVDTADGESATGKSPGESLDKSLDKSSAEDEAESADTKA